MNKNDAVVGNVKRLREEVRENNRVTKRALKQAFKEIDRLKKKVAAAK